MIALRQSYQNPIVIHFQANFLTEKNFTASIMDKLLSNNEIN
jgi:hypothetical protein